MFFAKEANCSIQTLRNRLKEHEPRIIRSKKAFVIEISNKNLTLRRQYGERWHKELFHLFWSFIYWTDEAHIDRSIAIRKHIFREVGEFPSNDPTNQQFVPKDDMLIHIAASVSWWHKSDLTFYHVDHLKNKVEVTTWKKRRPRKKKTKSEDEFKASERFIKWQSDEPRGTIKRGNSLNQKEYPELVLPQHIACIKER